MIKYPQRGVSKFARIKCFFHGHEWFYSTTPIPHKRYRVCRRCGKAQLIDIFT